MKIKVKPDDFIVQEVPDLIIGNSSSRYKIYSLEKTNWDTFDLMDFLSRKIPCSKRDLSYGGIKDRYGKTSQLISIPSRPDLPALISEKNFTLRGIGFSREPMTAKRVKGNRFIITLRDLSSKEPKSILKNLDIVQKCGIPNYYDDQRFGSARHGKGFMGKEIFLGRREDALKLFFQPSRYDKPKDRKFKASVVQNWGQWRMLQEHAYGEFRKILQFLSTEGFERSFTRVLSLINKKYLVFVLNAYQSFLFNEICKEHLRILQKKSSFDVTPFAYLMGEFLFYGMLPEKLTQRLQDKSLPVPAYDTVIEDTMTQKIVQMVLDREGLSLNQLRVRKIDRVQVHAKERKMMVLPENVNASSAEDDDLYPRRKKLRIDFYLPRGSYATLLIKRITQGADLEK